MPVCELIINNRIPRKPYARNEALYGMAGKPFLAVPNPSRVMAQAEWRVRILSGHLISWISTASASSRLAI